VLDDYEEYEVTTKEIKFAILEMLRNTQVTYDEPETEVKRWATNESAASTTKNFGRNASTRP